MGAERRSVTIVGGRATTRVSIEQAIQSLELGFDVVHGAAARIGVSTDGPHDILLYVAEAPEVGGVESALSALQDISAAKKAIVVTEDVLPQVPSALGPPDIRVCPLDRGHTTRFLSAFVGLLSLSERARLLPQAAQRAPTTAAVIGIGASTGGIPALREIVTQLTPRTPPVLVVQHTRSESGKSLARLLDNAGTVRVVEAQCGATLATGHVYIAGDRARHLVLDHRRGLSVGFLTGAPISGHKPSIDCLFDSLAALGAQAVGVLLTGMGRDGAQGLKHMYDQGGWTVGQDEASSVVYGMPKAAAELGALKEELSLSSLAGRLGQIRAAPLLERSCIR